MFIMIQLYNRKGEIRGGATTPYTLPIGLLSSGNPEQKLLKLW
jgi:hypothetical protein